MNLGWAAVTALVMVEMGILGLRLLSPKKVEGEFGSVLTIGNAQDFPPGSVTPFPNGRFYLVRLEDGGLLALYRKCTHLGCAVPWDQAAGEFICPCPHLSRMAW